MKFRGPSLVDLCVEKAIDNIRYLGDVGETDAHLLERILPHGSAEILAHIENSTQGRDLSPITNKLWKRFYELQFGANSTNVVVERMKQKKVTFKWKQLYEAKQKDLEDAQEKSFNRIRDLYKEENARKQSRQVQICTKVPPAKCKRSFFGGGPGSSVCNTKSNLMKKAKIEFLNSREVKNLAAINSKAVQRSPSVPSVRKPIVTSGTTSSSTSKLTRPMQRRF